MATENKFLKVDHENYDWSGETMSRVPADGTIWWYDDNGYIFSIVGNGTDDVETLRADQIEAYTQAVTKAGCQCDIDGEGYVSGESTVVDHSGTQNPATATDVEPVDSKQGKTLHYNGVTSNLEFDNPVIGTTGTIRFIQKCDDSVSQTYFDNTSSAYISGIRFSRYESYTFISIGDSTSAQDYNIGITPDGLLTMWHMVLNIPSGTITVYKNGGYVTTVTTTKTTAEFLNNLTIGKKAGVSEGFYNGDASFNYTIEIFDADQVKSDYNNPRKFSNEPVSQTPTAYTMSQHDGNGHTIMEFATKTATSAGNQGAIAIDATNVYFCIADSSWMKIPLQSI